MKRFFVGVFILLVAFLFEQKQATNTTPLTYQCPKEENFTCSKTGRFRNPKDSSCKSYYYCYEWSNGTVGQYDYTCSVGLFNPDTQSCDPVYVCPEDETFTCTETGRFRNPEDSSCKSYYYCYEWSNGTVGQYDYTCAVGLFNPDTHSCDPTYVCPDDGTFTCDETGRFLNPKDSTCKSYYYCYKWSNGTVGQYDYTCSVGLFNPDTHSCDPKYVCPCADSTDV